MPTTTQRERERESSVDKVRQSANSVHPRSTDASSSYIRKLNRFLAAHHFYNAAFIFDLV